MKYRIDNGDKVTIVGTLKGDDIVYLLTVKRSDDTLKWEAIIDAFTAGSIDQFMKIVAMVGRGESRSPEDLINEILGSIQQVEEPKPLIWTGD